MSEDINKLFELGGQSYQLIKQVGLINEEFGQAEVETNPADVLYKVMEWFVSDCYDEVPRIKMENCMSKLVQQALNQFYAAVPADKHNQQMLDMPLKLVRLVDCEGQSNCLRCHKHGKWKRNWTSMMYRIVSPDSKREYLGHYCADCAKDLRKLTYQEFEKMREDNKI